MTDYRPPTYLEDRYAGKAAGVRPCPRMADEIRYTPEANDAYRRIPMCMKAPLCLRNLRGIHDANRRGLLLGTGGRNIAKYPIRIRRQNSTAMYTFYINPYHSKWYENLCHAVAKAMGSSYVDVKVINPQFRRVLVGSAISSSKSDKSSESAPDQYITLKQFGLSRLLEERTPSSSMKVEARPDLMPRSEESLVDTKADQSNDDAKLQAFASMVEARIADRIAGAIWDGHDAAPAPAGKRASQEHMLAAWDRTAPLASDHMNVLPHVVAAFSDPSNYDPGDSFERTMNRIGAIYPGCMLERLSRRVQCGLNKLRYGKVCAPSYCRPRPVTCCPLPRPKPCPRPTVTFEASRCHYRNRSCLERCIHRMVSRCGIYRWLSNMKYRFLMYLRSKSNMYGCRDEKKQCCRDDMVADRDPPAIHRFHCAKHKDRKLCKRKRCKLGRLLPAHWWGAKCASKKKPGCKRPWLERDASSESDSDSCSSSSSSSSGSDSSSSSDDEKPRTKLASSSSSSSSAMYASARSSFHLGEQLVQQLDSLADADRAPIGERLQSASAGQSSIGAPFNPLFDNVIGRRDLLYLFVKRAKLKRKTLEKMSRVIDCYPYVLFVKKSVTRNDKGEICWPSELAGSIKKITKHVYCNPCDREVWLLVDCHYTMPLRSALEEIEDDPVSVLKDALKCAWGRKEKCGPCLPPKKLEEPKNECERMLREMLKDYRRLQALDPPVDWRKEEAMRDLESRTLLGRESEGPADHPAYVDPCKKLSKVGQIADPECAAPYKKPKCTHGLMDYEWERHARFRHLWGEVFEDEGPRGQQLRDLYKPGEEWLVLAPSDRIIGSRIGTASMNTTDAVRFLKAHSMKMPDEDEIEDANRVRSICGTRSYRLGANLETVNGHRAEREPAGDDELFEKHGLNVYVLPVTDESYKQAR